MRQGAAQSAPTSFPSTTTRIIMLIIVNRSRLLYYSSCSYLCVFKRTFKKHPTPFLPLLFRHLKARALLHPFFGFNLSVPVQVGAKVPMSADAAARIVQQQRAHQHAQRMALPPGTRIGRPPFFVQSALIADADGTCVAASCMRPNPPDGAHGFYIPVLADIKVIAASVESPASVTHRGGTGRTLK